MEDIFEEIHNEFINSEEYFSYLNDIYLYEEKNITKWKSTY
jgi:hypothetical protein